MSKLSDYRKIAKLTQSAFAERIGTSQKHVSELEAKRADPSFDIAKKIEIETEGAVLIEDWPCFAYLKERVNMSHGQSANGSSTSTQGNEVSDA